MLLVSKLQSKQLKNTKLLRSQLAHPPAPRQVHLFPASPGNAYVDSFQMRPKAVAHSFHQQSVPVLGQR